MSGEGSNVRYSGVNKQGNEYRVYDNGGYYYKNSKPGKLYVHIWVGQVLSDSFKWYVRNKDLRIQDSFQADAPTLSLKTPGY